MNTNQIITDKVNECIEAGRDYGYITHDGLLDIVDTMDDEILRGVVRELERLEADDKLGFELQF